MGQNDLIPTILKNDNFRGCWWRGSAAQEKKKAKLPYIPNSLIPSLFWSGMIKEECRINLEFRAKAEMLYPGCPGREELVKWLFLARHYLVPSRLLDWSESPLVALYMAVNDVTTPTHLMLPKPDESNEKYKDDLIKHMEKKKIEDEKKPVFLYCLRPEILLKKTHENLEASTILWNYFEKMDDKLPYGNPGQFENIENDICFPDHPVIGEFARRAFNGSLARPTDIVIPVRPEPFDKRQHMQHSVFTLHGGKDSKIDAEHMTIENATSNRSTCFCLTISAEQKQSIRKQLGQLQITHSSIYPDLEHLALDVMQAAGDRITKDITI